jgi:hypothetical protein
MVDTTTLHPGDVIAWHIWDGTEATATITSVGRFAYSRTAPDGHSESIDHHWAGGPRANRYRLVRP